MAQLKRQDILAVKDIRGEVVDVPEWGGEVFVRALSAGDVILMSRSCGATSGDIPLILFAVVDEQTGERLFTEADLPALMEKSLAPLRRVLDVAKRLSGLDDLAPKVNGASS